LKENRKYIPKQEREYSGEKLIGRKFFTQIHLPNKKMLVF